MQSPSRAQSPDATTTLGGFVDYSFNYSFKQRNLNLNSTFDVRPSVKICFAQSRFSF